MTAIKMLQKRVRETFLFLSFIACLCVAIPDVWAQEPSHDRLYLKNGDRFSGQFRFNKDNQIVFRPIYGAVINVPHQDVDYIHRRDGSLWRPDNAVVTARESQEIVTGSEQAQAAETAQAEGFEPIGNGINKLFGVKTDGRIALGLNRQTGNTDKSGANLDARIRSRLTEQHRLTLGGEYKMAKDNKIRTEDRKNIYGIHDYFVAEKWFLSSNAKFETDNISDLELETTLGVGLGYQFFDRDDLKLSVTAGPSYIRRNFETAPTEETIAGRWSLDYEQQFLEDAFRVFHNHTILQGFDEANNFRFESKTGLSLPVNNYLRAIGQVDFDYRGQVAPTVNRTDTKYSVNLGYEW